MTVNEKNQLLNRYIYTENIDVYDEIAWFTDIRTNKLFNYDLKTGQIKVACVFAEENENAERLFGDVVNSREFVYLVPFNAQGFYVYNKRSMKCERFIIDKCTSNKAVVYNSKARFLSAHLFENKIVMIGASYPAIVTFDCNTYKFAYSCEWLSGVEEGSSKEIAFFRKTMLKDGIIYAPCCRSNQVLAFDINNNRAKWYKVGRNGNRYSAMCYDGTNFWIAPREGDTVVKWNFEKNIYEDIRIGPHRIIDIFYCYGKIICLPDGWESPVVIDASNKQVDVLKNNYYRACVYCNEYKMLLYSNYCGQLYELCDFVEERWIIRKLPMKCYSIGNMKTGNLDLLMKEETLQDLVIFSKLI